MKYHQKKRTPSPHLSLLQFPLKRKVIKSPLNYKREIERVLQQTPDIRAEKVAMLKKAIWAGTYWVETEKIADKLIQESILDLIL